MRKFTDLQLDDYEKEILEAIDKGEFVDITSEKEKKKLIDAAIYTKKLMKLQEKASKKVEKAKHT